MYKQTVTKKTIGVRPTFVRVARLRNKSCNSSDFTRTKPLVNHISEISYIIENLNYELELNEDFNLVCNVRPTPT